MATPATALQQLDRIEITGHVEPVGSIATDLIVIQRPVPRGPRGLWAALDAVGEAPPALRQVSALPEVRNEAHLDYLAALV